MSDPWPAELEKGLTSAPDRSARFPDMPGVLHAYGFPRWKWPFVRQCFPGRRVVFLRQGDAVPVRSWLVLWGMTPVPTSVGEDVCVLRMEDGFLRSAGLGADLVRPLSWVVDRRGIYYDAMQPSDLETILATGNFDAALCARAARLRSEILAASLTKYNVGSRVWRRPAGTRPVVLVPGQVESDASLAFGSGSLRRNLELLRAVREARPEAYIIYKPHPDVLARLRLEGRGESEAQRWCDEVISDVAMGELLTAVDEVHVLTSLTGFEALLRDKPVTCYGQPFYAGWGLTRDMVPIPRRVRKLSPDELVAGVLIEYPLYLSRRGRHLITPEQAVETLVHWRRQTGGRDPWWRGIYRVLLRRIAGVR